MRRSRVLGLLVAWLVAAGAALAQTQTGKPPFPLPANSGEPIVSAIEDAAQSLKGMDAESVRAHLGDPVLIRREPPAQVWQYADRYCVMLLFLYDPKHGGGPPRVEYAEGRMRPGYEHRADLCLSGQPAPDASASSLPPASPVTVPGQDGGTAPANAPAGK